MGYPIPSKMGGCLAFILIIIGLTAFVVPGVLILIWVWYQGNQYERDMRQLVAKWVDAGKPTPGKKQNLEKTLEIIPEKNSEEEMEKKLKDLLSMKERNLISDEEYKEMRKKILGL
jgi:flagellar basal body-associated protein FliL